MHANTPPDPTPPEDPEVIAGGLLWDVDFIKVFPAGQEAELGHFLDACKAKGFDPSTPAKPTGITVLFFSNGSSLSFPGSQGDELSSALASTADGRLVFPFALEEAGEAFWRRALRGDPLEPGFAPSNTYWYWERN